MQTIPWVDKYRPHILGNIVHQPELMKTLNNILLTGEMPHLLFYGPPGTGKTTTILAFANELFGNIKIRERILELNASDDRGISVVRSEIVTFAKRTVGSSDPNFKCPPYKILILDEADAMTSDAQAALRKVMEETSAITRFCIICNYVDKIIDPIISRCMQFRFTPIIGSVMKKRLKYIANKEKLKLNDDIFDVIINVVDGDLRKGIMLLQNIHYVSVQCGTINVDVVNDLVGRVPFKMVMEMFNTVKQCSIGEIVNITQNFCSLGYPIINLCEQLSTYLISENKISDENKAKIFSKIANVYCKLNDGSGELLQLMKLLSFIRSLNIT